MALTLIKEDGTGRADANIYASVADCDWLPRRAPVRVGMDGGDCKLRRQRRW